jgi:hypothetical protein
MKWFRCPSPNLPSMVSVEYHLGAAGAWEASNVLRIAQEFNDTELDEMKVKKWAGVKIDRAKRLLPFCIKIIKESQEIFKNLKKSSKISENLSKSKDSEAETLTALHVKENRLEENRLDNKTPKPLKGDAAGFDEFWKNYPRAKNKKAALKAWNKLEPSQELRATIQQAIVSQSGSKQWQKDNGEFIPHPASWLNGERWDDVLEPANSPIKPQSLNGRMTDPDHKNKSLYWHFKASDGRKCTIHSNHLRRMNQNTLEITDKHFPRGLDTEYDIRSTEFMPANAPDG